MLNLKIKLTIVILAILLIGLGFIAYYGRPVMQLQPNLSTSSVGTDPATQNIDNTAQGNDNFYTLNDISKHSTKNDCWAAINNDVYDLTSWVSRHPGGSKTITSICGIDGTLSYNGQHRRDRKAKKYLVLLKIGQMK